MPVLSAIAVGMLAVNISRVFLAGSEDAALISAIVITLAILIGASLLAAAPHMRTSSLAMVLGLIVVIVVFGGLLTVGPSITTESAATGFVPPTGPATSTVTVDAGAGLTFNNVPFKSNYTATAGVVEIDYGGDAGHTLAFKETALAGFELKSPPAKPGSGKVELKAGTYNIYCTIPGHAAAGMQATITVAPAA